MEKDVEPKEKGCLVKTWEGTAHTIVKADAQHKNNDNRYNAYKYRIY